MQGSKCHAFSAGVMSTERKMEDNYVIKYDMAICPRTNFSFVSLADSLDLDSKGDGPNGILYEAMCEGCLLPLSPYSSRFYDACVKCRM